MGPRYEVAYSLHNRSLKLLLLEGGWERLPFEVSLMHPWCGSASCAETDVSVLRRREIAQQGYSIEDVPFLRGEMEDLPAALTPNDEPARIISKRIAFAEDHNLIRVMRQAAQDMRHMREQSKGLLTAATQALQAADQLLRDQLLRTPYDRLTAGAE